MHTHCTHTPLITASHEPPPSIHMSVSEPVGQNLCFLPGTEGSQAGVYACMCTSLCMCLRMHVNGKAFSGCRTLYVSLCNQEGRTSVSRANTHTHTQSAKCILVERHWWQRAKSVPRCVFMCFSCTWRAGHGNYIQDDINMCSGENLLIQNWFRNWQRQAQGDGFNSIWRQSVCVR